MKSISVVIVLIVVLLFVSDKIYQYYSRHFINAHESIVLINNGLSHTDIDTFFNLKKGTFNTEKYKVVFSLERKNASKLAYYINLPTKNSSDILDSKEFDCQMEYKLLRHFGFYDYELGNINIIARVITKESNPIKQLNSKNILSKKYLDLTFNYGSIHVFDINLNHIVNHCQ